MKHAIIFHPEAHRELTSLYTYIADRDGPERAWTYVAEIREFCDRPTLFPKRGTERTEIARGLRLVGFRRRCGIAFTVIDASVIILGVFYAGRSVTGKELRRRLRD